MCAYVDCPPATHVPYAIRDRCRADAVGEIGDGLPYINVGTSTVEQAIIGSEHHCVILTGGVLKCWGRNDFVSSTAAVLEAVGTGAAVGVGVGTCCLLLARTGRLTRCAPFPIVCGCAGPAGAWTHDPYWRCARGWARSRVLLAQLRMRASHTLTSTPLPFPFADTAGEMGNALVAVNVGTGRKVVNASIGGLHTCALLDNGAVKCWG